MPPPKCLNPSPHDTRWLAPIDVRDLAIRLETEGVSDAVARADFGFAGAWEMAEGHFPALSRRMSKQQAAGALSNARRRNVALEYLTGISFGLPLLFSCLAILLLKFSLWGGELPSNQASAIGLGIACSFIATGGFVQAMSRRGLWYIGTGQFGRCSQSTCDWLRRAAVALLLFGLAGIAVNTYFDWLPSARESLAAAFYFSLALLWLSTGVLYMLRRNLLVAATVLLGIGSVVLLHRGFHINLLGAQVASIILAAAFATAVSMSILKRQRQHEAGPTCREPAGRTLYYVWPYFTYGCLYYLFLFSDRLLAWTAQTATSGFAIQFRGAYEAGLDVALLAFIFQVGWAHSATVHFYERLKARQEELSIDQAEEFNRSLTALYCRMAATFLPLAIVTIAAVYFGARGFGFFENPLHRNVTAWALAGYLLLVLSLRNVILLFALSRPLYVLRAIGCACVVNITVGYVLSRFVSYDLAVIGFALGSAVFACISTWYSLQTLRRLDYYYFASAA